MAQFPLATGARAPIKITYIFSVEFAILIRRAKRGPTHHVRPTLMDDIRFKITEAARMAGVSASTL
ncbi:MAG: hypothetical protein ABW055_00620, partial [Pararhizobium sp.]